MNRSVTRMVSGIITVSMGALLLLPSSGQAMTNEEIDAKIANLKKQEDKVRQSQKKAAEDKKKTTQEKNQVLISIQQLVKQIDEQTFRIHELDGKIDDTTVKLKDAGKQLDEAQQRVESRDEMLKSRVRLMYTNGVVSYLDVLLSANSFTDFLNRYQALKTIVGQDKEMLEANKVDRDTVKAKKQEIEEHLQDIQVMYAEASRLKDQMVAQENEKKKRVQTLSKQEQAYEEIDEESERQLVELIKQKSALANQKQKIDYYKGGKLGWPLPGHYTITSGFGNRTDPFTKANAYHSGIDIGAPQGTAIIAAESGVVINAGFNNGGYGNLVVIDHGSGLTSWYGHIRQGGILVKEGQTVKKGDKIAEVGMTGRATGNHLHFEVRQNGNRTDPMPFVK
ncbi:peptidoglycan DD-metalloendopeptidase family protein [Paenibacillus sp. y28]